MYMYMYYVPSIEKLLQRLLDNDEKVRLTTVKIISEVAIEDLSSVPSEVSNHAPCGVAWAWSQRCCTIVSVCLGYMCIARTDERQEGESTG